jgi:hypothetical protein
VDESPKKSSFWEFTARAKAEVDNWPAWKRNAANAAFVTEVPKSSESCLPKGARKEDDR